jgi:type III secretion protein U
MILFQMTLFFSMFFAMIFKVGNWLTAYTTEILTSKFDFSTSQILSSATGARDLFLQITFLALLASIVGGLVGVFAQIGLLFAPEAIAPSFKKFNVVENVKNMFSLKSITQLLISVLKVFFFLIIFYYIFTRQLQQVIFSYREGLDGILIIVIRLMKILVFSALVLFIFLSAVDWATVFFFHRKNLRMSKQEVFDEYKQQEGDPHVKSHRKQTHRSLINSSLSNVSKAKVVVANPTHIAVALDYEPGVHDLPFVLALETDEFAYLLRKGAYELGIPVIRNVELARGIYLDGEVNQYIPSQHVKLAAAVFREVIALAKAQKEREALEKQGLEENIATDEDIKTNVDSAGTSTNKPEEPLI